MKHALVMGLGQFGGGLGAALHLLEQGHEVLVTDKSPAQKLAGPLLKLAPYLESGQARTRLGEHRIEDFAQAELVVANPAVPAPWKNELLLAARAGGARVVSEINLLVPLLPQNRTIGITGAAGKSTTAALTHSLLQASGRKSLLGGNIGGSLLQSFESGSKRPAEGDTPGDWVVLELSSFMLWWLGEGAAFFGGQTWHPAIGALTNLAPNHIDWHGSFAHYANSKRGVRGPGSRFISHFSTSPPSGLGPTDVWWQCEDSSDVPPAEAIEMMVPGLHQRRNAKLAWALAKMAAQAEGASLPDAAAMECISGFKGLEHRLQFVGEFAGIRCFNDSKATTPEATALAVGCFDDPQRVHLIVGGADKGADLSIVRDMSSRLAGLYTIGTTGAALGKAPGAHPCGTLEVAVGAAAARARVGDVLLLSPACASWDQFVNFEKRGELFVQLVRSLGAEESRAGLGAASSV